MLNVQSDRNISFRYRKIKVIRERFIRPAKYDTAKKTLHNDELSKSSFRAFIGEVMRAFCLRNHYIEE